MKKLYCEEKGLTLVELLAVLVIGAIVMLIVTNIFISAQKQYFEQSVDAGGLFDVTLAAKEITKEIRKNPESIIIEDDRTIIFNKGEDQEVKYQLIGETLQRNGHDYIYNIDRFEVSPISSIPKSRGDQVRFLIVSKTNTEKKVDTKITIR